MLFQVVIENGVKKLVPLTADTGAGNPVGSLLHTYKKSNPSGYLYCDGSTFDQTKYPLLYAYLGSNVLPDYRECVEVGAEENTTDTIADHDVYTEGQFKDDQLQTHKHNVGAAAVGGSSKFGFASKNAQTLSYEEPTDVNTGRSGTTTHGKQKAVFIYIKATSGISENAQDNVINTLNEERSYSTEEVNTGKKWIDGKPIYRKVITSSTGIAHNTVLIENVDTVINAGGTQQYLDNEYYNFPWIMSVDNNIRWVLKNDNKIYTYVQISYTYKNVKWWFEYTKTV